MRKKPSKLKVTTITCPLCKEEIYSRANHDFRTCSCGECSVDGGRSYLKFSWNPEKFGMDDVVRQIRELDVTEQDLYDDWNKGIDKLGKFHE